MSTRINDTPRVNEPPLPRELIALAIDWRNAGRKVALVTLVNIEGNAPYPVGSQMLVDEAGRFAGQITGGCAESAIADQAAVAINLGENQRQRYGLGSPFFDIQLPCGSGIDVFFDCQLTLEYLREIQAELTVRRSVVKDQGGITKTYRPTARLLIMGQGPIVVQLAQLAMQSSYEAICVAQNTDTEKMLAQADLRFHSQTSGVKLAQSCDEYTGMVSLFHEHDLETPLLAEALQTDAFYIGALGSQRTQSSRLAQLRSMGVSESQLARIHGPVGLNIGADTPGQIAVSILAELIGVMNQRGIT